MTVTELYDQLSDDELKEAFSNEKGFAKIKRKHQKHIDRYAINFEVTINLYKQAATRWLKNQSK